MEENILDKFVEFQKDFPGVYLLYLIDNDDCFDIFNKNCINYIKEEVKRTNNLIYIGESKHVNQRINCCHLHGTINNSTLRKTLNLILSNESALIKELQQNNRKDVIFEWLDRFTYFKVYKTEHHKSLQDELIQKYSPVFNDNRRILLNMAFENCRT